MRALDQCGRTVCGLSGSTFQLGLDLGVLLGDLAGQDRLGQVHREFARLVAAELLARLNLRQRLFQLGSPQHSTT